MSENQGQNKPIGHRAAAQDRIEGHLLAKAKSIGFTASERKKLAKIYLSLAERSTEGLHRN